MSSPTEIANRALQRLGDTPILDLDDNVERARIMKRAYDPVRRAELRAHPWNFSIQRTALPADATAPAFGFARQFTLPSDCVRVLRSPDGRDWTREGRKILTDDTIVQIRYVSDVVNCDLMDELFREAFAARLAIECCEKVTQSTAKKADIKADYKDLILEARRVNAFEQIPDELPEDDWLLARY